MKRCVFLLLIVSLTGPVLANAGWIERASVVRTLVQDNKFGNCMVFLDKIIADVGLDCPSRWVTFSCDGTFTSRDVATRQFDTALMAFALDKKVSVFIDDTKKHNGFCLAKRIDVVK